MTAHEIAELVTAFAAVGAVVASVIGLYRLHTLHIQLNSRMDELLKAAVARGIVQERAAQDARDVIKSKRMRKS